MRWTLFFLAALGACAASRPGVEPDDPATIERPAEGDEPMAATPVVNNFTTEVNSVWAFLAQKYDTNGDQVVSANEYDRGEESFARLDRNRDGKVNAADFRRGRGRMATYVSQMTLMRYFQDDDNAQELSLQEVQTQFKAIDTGKDGELTPDEIVCAIDAVDQAAENAGGGARRMPAGMKPEQILVETCDQDKSGGISSQEIETYFKSRDSDGDGLWKQQRRGGRRGQRNPRPMTGVPPGQPAPDFTLKDPHGNAEVTLSSFRGKRPVALIFGSYT